MYSKELLQNNKKQVSCALLRPLYSDECVLETLSEEARAGVTRRLNEGEIPPYFPVPRTLGLSKTGLREVVDDFSSKLLKCLGCDSGERPDIHVLVEACLVKAMRRSRPTLSALVSNVGKVAEGGRATTWLDQEARGVASGSYACIVRDGELLYSRREATQERREQQKRLDELFLELHSRYASLRDQVRDSDAASTCKELFVPLLPLFESGAFFSSREMKARERQWRVEDTIRRARRVKAGREGASLYDEFVVGGLADCLEQMPRADVDEHCLIVLEDRLNELKARADEGAELVDKQLAFAFENEIQEEGRQ